VTIEIVAKLRPEYCCDSTMMDKALKALEEEW